MSLTGVVTKLLVRNDIDMYSSLYKLIVTLGVKLTVLCRRFHKHIHNGEWTKHGYYNCNELLLQI